MHHSITRRRFLARGVAAGFGLATASLTFPALARATVRILGASAADLPDLALARGSDPARNCLAAIEALGGFARFVKPGDKVVVKPNPVGGNRPERAINTHPAMIGAVVRGCLAAGAREVVAISHDEARGFDLNGTRAAVEDAGGRIVVLSLMDQFFEIPVPRGRILRRIHVARELADADLFVNMPIAKHHAGSQFTGGMKNLMGINWDRQVFHATDLHQCIAELASAIPHSLVLMDANHVLLNNGPIGPGQVITPGEVIASCDPVAVDAFAMKYFSLGPDLVSHIRMAHELGVGSMALDELVVKEVAA
jgi:uncharacterized protein (DUF362 family)